MDIGVRAHIPLSRPLASTQYHLIADFDAKREIGWGAKNFNFNRWATVVIFPARFRINAGDHIVKTVLVSSCSLCPHAVERHHHFGDPDIGGSLGDESHDYVALPPDFSVRDLLLPCHHARAAIASSLRSAERPLTFSTIEALEIELRNVCMMRLPPQKFPHRQLIATGVLDAYATADRLYHNFVTITSASVAKVFCSSCNSSWRTSTPCTHFRDFKKSSPASTTDADVDSDRSKRRSHKPRLVHSKQRYPCMLSIAQFLCRPLPLTWLIFALHCIAPF